MDDAETLRRFKDELKAPFPFVSDEKGRLAKTYGVRLLFLAKRTTFVIGEGRKVLHVESGGDAIDPSDAVAACPVRPPAGE